MTAHRPVIQGIVFDAVGTLIRPDPSVSAAYAAAAARQGVELDRSLVRARFARGFAEHHRDAGAPTSEAVERERWRRIVAGVLPEVPDLGRAFDELWEHFAQPRSWRCFPDVRPALERLQAAGFPIRIASNFDARLRAVIAGLPDLAAIDLEAGVVISSEAGFRKPDPRFYEAVRRSLNLPAASLLVVGDDPENDRDAPRQAGLQALLLDREQARDDFDHIPDLLTLADRLGVS